MLLNVSALFGVSLQIKKMMVSIQGPFLTEILAANVQDPEIMKHAAADFGGSKGEEMPRWGENLRKALLSQMRAWQCLWSQTALMPLCAGCKTLGELTSLKPRVEPVRVPTLQDYSGFKW